MIGTLAIEYVAAAVDARETRRYWQRQGRNPTEIAEQMGLAGTAWDWGAIESEMVAHLMRTDVAQMLRDASELA